MFRDILRRFTGVRLDLGFFNFSSLPSCVSIGTMLYYDALTPPEQKQQETENEDFQH